MQKQLEEIKAILIKRIYDLFIEKYEGNKSKFAKDVGCDEKTIRLIFNHNQGMTMNLFFKISKALAVEPSELIKDLKIKE